MKTPAILIPIKILTKKIAKNKQNSIFYAGKNIAEVKILNRTYVLTSAGSYSFKLKANSTDNPISFDSCTPIGAGAPGRTRYNTVKNLTDSKIKSLGDNDLVFNWGWFGINIWEKQPKITQTQPGNFSITPIEVCLNYPTEVWSDYNEALKSFIEYVERDLIQ